MLSPGGLFQDITFIFSVKISYLGYFIASLLISKGIWFLAIDPEKPYTLYQVFFLESLVKSIITYALRVLDGNIFFVNSVATERQRHWKCQRSKSDHKIPSQMPWPLGHGNIIHIYTPLCIVQQHYKHYISWIPWLFVVNISQIKHTWFSFDFLFITDLSNYNAVVFTGKRLARIEGVQAFILSMKRESQNKEYTESPTKNIRNLPSTIKRFTL